MSRLVAWKTTSGSASPGRGPSHAPHASLAASFRSVHAGQSHGAATRLAPSSASTLVARPRSGRGSAGGTGTAG